MTILTSTIVHDIWQTFHDRLESVTSVTITGSVTVTIQSYRSSYSDDEFDTKSNLPIMIIETPILDIDNFTMGKSVVDGSIQIEIYTTQSESADKFCSSILDSIETYKHDLADLGLKDVKGSIVDTDFAQRGKIKVHVRRIRFTYKYYYDKTESGY